MYAGSSKLITKLDTVADWILGEDVSNTLLQDLDKMSGTKGASVLNEAEGIVEAFVAGISNKDSVGDIIEPGAFDSSLKQRQPRVVWGHDWNRPIGKVLEIREVSAGHPSLPDKMRRAGIGGLYAKVQFNLLSERGREAFADVAFMGQDQEWSIGYKTHKSKYDTQRKANLLQTVELFEVSPVLHGANQLTGTVSVKSGDGEKNLDLEDDFKMALYGLVGDQIELLETTENRVIFKNLDGESVAVSYVEHDGEHLFGTPTVIDETATETKSDIEVEEKADSGCGGGCACGGTKSEDAVEPEPAEPQNNEEMKSDDVIATIENLTHTALGDNPSDETLMRANEAIKTITELVRGPSPQPRFFVEITDEKADLDAVAAEFRLHRVDVAGNKLVFHEGVDESDMKQLVAAHLADLGVTSVSVGRLSLEDGLE